MGISVHTWTPGLGAQIYRALAVAFAICIAFSTLDFVTGSPLYGTRLLLHMHALYRSLLDLPEWC